MMRTTVLTVIVLITVMGGVAHRLTLSIDKSLTVAQVQQREVQASKSSLPVMELTQNYLNEEDGLLREQMLAELSAEQISQLVEELTKQQKPSHELFPFWAETDVHGLLSFIERHPLTDCYGSIGDCFRIEPESTLSTIERCKSAGLPIEKVNQWIDQAFANIGDPVAALNAAQKHGLLQDSEHLYRLNGLVTALGRQDAKAAVALAEKFPNVLDTALNVWSEKEPEAVLNWMRERLGKQVDTNILDSVLGYMAQQYPESAEQYLAIAQDKEAIYRGLATNFRRKPIEELTLWLDSLPEEGRSVAHKELCYSLQLEDRGKVAALCMTFPELVTPENSGNTGGFIVDWAKQNPAGAIQDYQAGKIPSAIADKILPEIVESLFLVDRPAAMAFIRAQPDSEQKGVLLLQTSRILQDGDRESALEYALHLPEPASRIGACLSLLPSHRAPELDVETKEWINSIPDAAVRQGLLKALEPKPEPEPTENPSSTPDPFIDPFAPVPE